MVRTVSSHGTASIVNRLLLSFLSVGLRRSEVAGLRWQDIDREQRTIRVRGKGSKWRTVAIDERTCAAMSAFHTRGEGPMFAFGTEALRARIRRLGARAGIPRLHPHLLRHSFAVAFLEASGEDGLTLQTLLGHASPAAFYDNGGIDVAGSVSGRVRPQAAVRCLPCLRARRPSGVSVKPSRAGVEATPHQCRHYWATEYLKRGSPLFLQQLGGWSSASMVQKYAAASLSESALAEARRLDQ